MIFGKTKLEMKVGVFVFIGLVVLVIFILSIGGFKTWSSGYHVKMTFNFVNGIKVGAPVRFAGVDVGEVQKIRLDFFPEESRSNVNLDIWVRNTVKIPSDSSVWVNTLGLLGEKYIEIMPGSDYSRVLTEGECLVGVDPLPVHKIFNNAENLLNNLNDGISRIKNKEGTLGKLIYDDTLYDELQALVTDVRKNPWKLFIRTKERK
ncbi:MAG: MlaD family protein [Candidatus Omnitrophica bacterium]|nr:MlaD family protein [Candidatus Omnitrophota bacterium]MDD5771037.1 MlaD family protein [Candidatus Omnitrophota bacterium]